MVNEQTTLTFELNIQEANVVITALSKLPYEQVADLIMKVRNQGAEQVEALNKQESSKEE